MPVVIRRRPKPGGGGGGHAHEANGNHEHAHGPSDDEFNDPKWRRAQSRLDADVFRGLREEMDRLEAPKTPKIFVVCNSIVIFCIMANSAQMGLAIQDKDGQFDEVFSILEHIAGVIFTLEMIGKLYYQRKAYFSQTWNLLDFFLVWMSILSNWIFPLTSIKIDLSVFIVLRLLRCLRIVKLLRAAPALRLLVEGMFKSMVSLGWILVLLGIITYLFSIICYQAIDQSLYTDMVDFDLNIYFGDLQSSMLTMFNMCILAEWAEVVRPVWAKQAYVVLFVFVPYLMLATFGVLNLIIGVIAEQTMESSAENTRGIEKLALREKMKAIMRMTDKLFHSGVDSMTKDDFINAALKAPDFIELMRSCEFPRGFEVANLHLIFDDSSEGTVDKDEFINGMFRLVFNDLSQHAATILLGIAQLKCEIKTSVEEELHTLVTHFIPQQDQEETRNASQISSKMLDVDEPVLNTEVDLDILASADSPMPSQKFDFQSPVPLHKDNSNSKLKHAKIMDDMDVRVTNPADDMDHQGIENSRTMAHSISVQSLQSRSSEDTLLLQAELAQQFDQIMGFMTQLRETSESTKSGALGVSAELASLRQYLSESQQKISLAQQPPLSDQSDWAAQVADALRPVIMDEMQKSKAASNGSLTPGGPWSKGFGPSSGPTPRHERLGPNYSAYELEPREPAPRHN